MGKELTRVDGFEVEIVETVIYSRKFTRQELEAYLPGHEHLGDAELAEAVAAAAPEALEEDLQRTGEVSFATWGIAPAVLYR